MYAFVLASAAKQSAPALAKATQRPVLAVFSGSDWCKPCMQLKQKVFDQPEFMSFAKDRLVLARFDLSAQQKELVRQSPNQAQ